MKTRMDKFIEKLNTLSDAPIKSLYEMGKDMYLNNTDPILETETVYNELLYFILTDLEHGYESVLKRLEMNNDIELIKDIIAFDCSKNAKIELKDRVGNINTDIEMEVHNTFISKKLKTFVYSSMSLMDDRYIDFLVEHLVNVERIDIDFLANFINQKVKGRRRVILKV